LLLDKALLQAGLIDLIQSEIQWFYYCTVTGLNFICSLHAVYWSGVPWKSQAYPAYKNKIVWVYHNPSTMLAAFILHLIHVLKTKEMQICVVTNQEVHSFLFI